MIKSNPFTPQSGWEPKSFNGREIQIEHFKKNIQNSLSTKRQNHMIILGKWGIGKTSLLKQFKKIAQSQGLLSAYCPISKFTEKDTTADGINLIAGELLKGFPQIKGLKKILEEIAGAGISIAGFGAQITRKKEIPHPQILLTDLLLKLWKHLDTKLAVVLMDDVQNFETISQIIDILRLVLSRDEIIAETNYLFILSSTPQGWSNFIDKHDPIGRFFRKREIILSLNKEETKDTIIKTLENTGVVFQNEIVNLIYKYTEGHPYELQVLCSNLYEAQIKGVVSKKQWDLAFQTTLSELGKEYFDSLSRKITDREEPVLTSFCISKREMNIKEIKNLVLKLDKSYPINDVRFYIYRLLNKGLIKKIEKNKYKILDNMFKEYFLLKK